MACGPNGKPEPGACGVTETADHDAGLPLLYSGPVGVVIRRQGHLYCDGDDVVWFAAEQAPAIAAAILEAAGLDPTALASEATRVGSKPKDSTAAERQRRYRECQKKESTADSFHRDDRDVTNRDTVTAA